MQSYALICKIISECCDCVMWKFMGLSLMSFLICLSPHKGLRGLFISSAVIPLALCWSGVIHNAYAQQVPPAADVGRIHQDQERDLTPYKPPDVDISMPRDSSPMAVPEGAETVHLMLKDIIIEGSTSFTPAQLSPLYTPYLNKDITLDQVYAIAARITDLYRREGYFLSLAYVPDQKIGDGVVRINVIEGHINTTEIDPAVLSQDIVRAYVNELTNRKPLKSADMESFLLKMNDLPGYSFRAVLSPQPDQPAGAIKLTLVKQEKSGHGLIAVDNFSSRFLGPNQISASYETSLFPLQQTSISGLLGLPADKLKYLTLEHSMIVAPDLKVNLSGNITRSRPGYSLEPLEIDSRSNSLSVGLEWQYLRQRDENISFSVTFDRQNTDIDFLDTPFTRDRVRALRLRANYDGRDDWGGYNWASLTLTRGLPVLGASKEGDDNLSRAEAKPDFTKAEVTMTHWQRVHDDVALVVSAAGQIASNALYSSEEFGYGGQSFGRAYDSSEITGDHGVSGAAELQYTGFEMKDTVGVIPYVFYDIGAVWNEDDGQPKRESGASAGLGTRIETSFGLSFNGGLAFPLTRSIESPVYGGDDDGPRVFLQLSQSF